MANEELIRKNLQFIDEGERTVRLSLNGVVQFRLSKKYYPTLQSVGDDIIKLLSETVDEILAYPDKEAFVLGLEGEQQIKDLQKKLHEMGF